MNIHRPFAAAALAAFLLVPCCTSEAKPKPGPTNQGTGDAKPAEPAAGKTPEKPAASSGSDKYTAKEGRLARAQFKSYCVTCHGTSGKGDGAAGAALNPKPRNWTDQEWQKTVTDERLFEVIRDGGAKHGLSPSMAPNPLYADQPGVLWALVDKVRSFRKE